MKRIKFQIFKKIDNCVWCLNYQKTIKNEKIYLIFIKKILCRLKIMVRAPLKCL